MVAERVRRLRQQHGWTAQQLADMCADAGLPSLTRGTIAKIESGVRQSVSADELGVLANVLGVTATELLTPDLEADELATRSVTHRTELEDPTTRRLQLGRALRMARKATGLTQAAVAAALSCSQGKINKFETTFVTVSRPDLDMMIELYGIGEEKAEELRQLAEIDRPDLRPRTKLVGTWSAFASFVNLESDASEICCWHSERIPAPLQSEHYMLRQHQTDSTSATDKVIRQKQARSRIFAAENPPSYRVVLSESSLHRMPGGRSPELIRDQVDHLLDLIAEHKHLTLQILSFDAPVPFVDSDFEILRFADGHSDFAYIESPGGARTFKRPNDLNKFEEHWRQLHDAALSREDSITFLEDLAKKARDE